LKKRQITIEEYKNYAGTHTIIINNARYQESFCNAIESIIKSFLLDKEVYFGFCRTDGMNLSLEEQKELKNKIPIFFQNDGNFQVLSEYLSVARSKLNNYSCSFIPLIFDYYLETIMFNPKVDWENFKEYYLSYQEHRFDEIILNHFAYVLFYYFDSGDFLICYDPKIYNSKDIRSMVELFWGNSRMNY